MYCSTLHFPKVMSMFEDFSENISECLHSLAIAIACIDKQFLCEIQNYSYLDIM